VIFGIKIYILSGNRVAENKIRHFFGSAAKEDASKPVDPFLKIKSFFGAKNQDKPFYDVTINPLHSPGSNQILLPQWILMYVGTLRI
jgi:hypothetical protein